MVVYSASTPQARDGEPLARVPLMARGTTFWARHRSKRSTAIDSSINEFSVRFSQFKELSEMLKFIMYPDVRSFYKLNLPQFDWMEIEEFEMQLINF
ncbi:general transcription factor II-I repeat domain-containing protein 2A [Trichonephila clavipes]|nr:general transcription factor II-I repeat domain-containing protein 2A [Trichonephila clavipes]